jgi:transposase
LLTHVESRKKLEKSYTEEMPKQNDYNLNETELIQVREAMKSPNGRVAQRATVLHSLHLGYRVEEVAQLHHLSRGSVYNHVQRFQAEGLAGLPDKPKRGRPRKASPEYIQLLEQAIAAEPREMGYGFSVWTQARLRQYLAQQTGIDISRSRFQELLERLGYVYRRPKRDLGQHQDPQLREQVIAALEELKKEPPSGISNYSLWTKPKSD